MIFKKEIFLLIFLILLQSCSGGRIGNFLEISFNDLEEKSQERESSENLKTKKVSVKENKESYNKKSKEKSQERESSENLKTKKVSVKENKESYNKKSKEKSQERESSENLKTKKVSVKENKEIFNENYEKIKNVEEPKSVIKNIKDQNLEKIQKIKNKKSKNSSKKRETELQSYKIIFILKNVDPKDPTEQLNTILRNSEVNFEIEKIERIVNSKNRIMNKN